MDRLGYPRYGVQGGDWGSAISRTLGRLRPDNVIGAHLNLLGSASVRSEPAAEALVALTPAEREQVFASWQKSLNWRRNEDGYNSIQRTRPQTIAFALADSPVGQLAWIAEKFHAWTDLTQGQWGGIDPDIILTNVSIYWFTNTAGSSTRLYYERLATDEGAEVETSNSPTAQSSGSAQPARPTAPNPTE